MADNLIEVPVTDPNILKTIPPEFRPDPKEVERPVTGDEAAHALAVRHAAEGRTAGETAEGYGKAAATAIPKGVSLAAGAPTDLYNMIGDATAGRGMAWLLDKFGASGAADWLRKNGYQDIQTGSSQGVEKAMRNMGVPWHDPLTPGEKLVTDTGGALTAGALTGGAGSLVGGTTAALPAAGRGAFTALGGDIGAKGVSYANKVAEKELGVPLLPDPLANLLGVILGSRVGAGGYNRGPGYTKGELQQTFDEAGVPIRFPSDINPKPGLIGRVLSGQQGEMSLPERLGAQGKSERSAEETQHALGHYAEKGIDPDQMSLTDQGLGVQSAVDDAVYKLQRQRKSAGREDQIATLKGVTEGQVPEQLPGMLASGTEQGATRLKSLIDAIEPSEGGELIRALAANRLRGAATDVGPGKTDLKGYMTWWNGQSPEYQKLALDTSPEFSETMAKLDAMYRATAPSRGLIDKASHEGAAGYADPGLLGVVGGAGLEGLTGLIERLAGEGGEAMAHAPEHGLSGLGMGAAAYPAVMRTAAQIAQSPMVAGRSGPITGNMIPGFGQSAKNLVDAPNVTGASGFMDKGAAVARNALADPYFQSGVLNSQTYIPPPLPAQREGEGPTKGEVHAWLGEAPREQSQAYVTRMLGPAVGAQLANTDDNSYKAALFALTAQPQFRLKLGGTSS